MYEQFYNLHEKPFGLLPDPAFIYWSHAHSMAYTMLEYGVLSNAGFTVITGGIGCGKTTLIRYLLTQLTEHVTVGLLSNTKIKEGELLRWVMMALGQPFEQPTIMSVFNEFQRFLIDQYARGMRTILIVDEAQNLNATALEELRMLSNINADKEQLLQIILVGQPELRDVLQGPELVQFVQRVSSDYHLMPLDPAEVYDYVKSRVIHAGGSPDLFSRQACKLLADMSRGIPRLINKLCDTALVYAYSEGARYVSTGIMSKVIDDKKKYGLTLK
jgi:type II secretory pathway predicted ATPase ExeA